MKKLFLTSVFALLSNFLFAQAWTGKGDQKIQAGANIWGFGSGIAANYDYGVADMISVGAGAHIYFNNFKNNDNKFFVFGRVNAHLQKVLSLPENFDVYPGLDVGLLGDGFGLGAHIGARYFFNDRFGAFAEVGNNGSIGISVNL